MELQGIKKKKISVIKITTVTTHLHFCIENSSENGFSTSLSLFA